MPWIHGASIQILPLPPTHSLYDLEMLLASYSDTEKLETICAVFSPRLHI